MAKFTGYTSDITGNVIKGEVFTLGVWKDRVMDPAGSMEDVYDYYDMSGEDCAKVLRRIFKHDPECAIEAIKYIKSKV